MLDFIFLDILPNGRMVKIYRWEDSVVESGTGGRKVFPKRKHHITPNKQKRKEKSKPLDD